MIFNQTSNCDFKAPTLLSHRRRGPEYKLCFPFFIWIAHNAVGQSGMGERGVNVSRQTKTARRQWGGKAAPQTKRAEDKEVEIERSRAAQNM